MLALNESKGSTPFLAEVSTVDEEEVVLDGWRRNIRRYGFFNAKITRQHCGDCAGLWPHGQAVKTPPFHGGNTGSNPVGVTIASCILYVNLRFGEDIPYLFNRRSNVNGKMHYFWF